MLKTVEKEKSLQIAKLADNLSCVTAVSLFLSITRAAFLKAS